MEKFNYSDFEYPINAFLNNEGMWRYERVLGAEGLDEPEADLEADPEADLEAERSERSESEVDPDEVKEQEDIENIEDSNDPDPRDLLDPKKFKKIFYSHAGENDGDSWVLIFQHENGYYVLFDASCDYTGFDRLEGGGGGLVYYTKSLEDMYERGMDDWTRSLVPDLMDTISDEEH